VPSQRVWSLLISESTADFQRFLPRAQRVAGGVTVKQEFFSRPWSSPVLRWSQIHIGDRTGDSDRQKIYNLLVFYPTSHQNL